MFGILQFLHSDSHNEHVRKTGKKTSEGQEIKLEIGCCNRNEYPNALHTKMLMNRSLLILTYRLIICIFKRIKHRPTEMDKWSIDPFVPE